MKFTANYGKNYLINDNMALTPIVSQLTWSLLVTPELVNI